MSAQSLDYIIIFGLGFIVVLLGYNFIVEGRALLQPEARVKSGAQMIYAGLALVILGFIVGVIAMLLVIPKR